ETITLPDRSPTAGLPGRPVKSAPGIFETGTGKVTRFSDAATQFERAGPTIVEVARPFSRTSQVHLGPERLSETTILNGRLAEAVAGLQAPATLPPAPQQPV